MRKMVAFLLVLSFIIVSLPAFAARDRKGAGDKDYQEASRESEFHRASDWIATREKSERETKAEREAKKNMQQQGGRTRKEKKKARKMNR